MLSTDAKERAGFTSFLASRAPRSKADFSTLKFQLLIVRLSQDLVSVDFSTESGGITFVDSVHSSQESVNVIAETYVRYILRHQVPLVPAEVPS